MSRKVKRTATPRQPPALRTLPDVGMFLGLAPGNAPKLGPWVTLRAHRAAIPNGAVFRWFSRCHCGKDVVTLM